MIRFKKIRWKNLLSTGNAWTEVQLDGHNMTLIIGKNGHGKSTLIDALFYVLFGKPFRKIRLDQIINSINNAELCVEVEFDVGQTQYKIIRGMRPGIFEIHEYGKLINQEAATKDQQKYLERNILGTNPRSFAQIVVIGGGFNYTPFMKLGPQDRRAIIENLLDIEVFSIMNTVVKTRVKSTNESLESIKGQIKTTMEKIDLQKKYISDSRKTNDELIVQKKSELSNSEIQITDLNNTANVTRQQILDLQDQINDESKIRTRIRTMEQLRIRIDTNIGKANKEIQFYSENEKCSTCQQDIKNADEMLTVCNHKLVEFQDGLKQLEVKQVETEQRLTAITQIHEQINQLQLQLTSVQSSVSQIQKYSSRLLTEIQALSSKKPISDDLLQVSKDLFKDLEDMTTKRRELIESKAYFDLAATLLKDNGIKTRIIKQYLPVINKLVNKYLAAMDFFVNFEIDGEFQETIKSRFRDTFSYENFSEGQKRRIDLSLLFTWRDVAKLKNSVNTNLLILDETLDGSLDSDGMEEFMRLLNSLGSDHNTFLISHRGDILADKFNNVLKFELLGNFSQVS
jgi:DNA repair exonuclease SbcCD ATPase subunit